MTNWLQTRNNQIWFIIIVLMSMLVIRLFSLTVVQGQQWKNASDNIRIKEIHYTAPRGEIKDRYGRVLAGNKPSFVVQLMGNELKDDKLNSIASTLINTFEKNGDSYIDNFPIMIQNGVYYYTYQKDIESWLLEQEMPLNYTAEQAFNALRERYNISDDLDKYEAQKDLQTVYNVFPDISVKNMKYLEDLEKEAFLQKYNLDTKLSAEAAFKQLREKFKIDSALSREQARKIMIIRDEVFSQGYRKYSPVKIAVGVSQPTIIAIEEKNSDFPGVEVIAEPVRYYPYGNLASHVLGYLGQIAESEKQQYVNQENYNLNDFIGKEGVEKIYEKTLKGTDGIKSVEVNAKGKLIRTISETAPVKGKDLYLTIDMDLQKTAEESLQKALTEIRRGGTYQSKWGNYHYSQAFPSANAGAVVALDVKTGEVLAMASNPSFDPNLFATGIKAADWEALQSKNPRDPLSPRPLFNTATLTAVQPGSTFKMITGLTAIENGLNPYKQLYDGEYIKLGNKTFGCDAWNLNRSSHGYVDFFTGLEVSCNYYFYDVISAYDYSKKQSLGYDNSISDVMNMAERFGLGRKTGIEIPETVVPVPSEQSKLKSTKALLKNYLRRNAQLYFDNSVTSNETLLNQKITQIISWTEENPSRTETYNRLQKLGVTPSKLYDLTDLCKFTYFNQAKWGIADKLNFAIGQGENAYTPVQMANYIATLSNGGYLNKVTLIQDVGGVKNMSPAPTRVSLKDYAHLGYAQQATKRIVSGSRGTARGTFTNFPIEVAGKTGTAQRSGKVNPPDEVAYIKQYLGRINPRLSFAQVEAEMNRLMKKYPHVYGNKDTAVRQAVLNLSNGKVTESSMDAYKQNYDNFAWFVSYAPYDDPQIAVAVLIFQGGHGNYAAPVAKDIIAQYLKLGQTYTDYMNSAHITE